jgi:hypothetical protein
MLKKLERDALAADLVAVEGMLGAYSVDDDPVGHTQFAYRKGLLEDQLAKLDQQVDRHAQLGVFFGGGPVQGSRGIDADFAGRAIEELQELITKRYSEQEGVLKQNGRLPLANQSKMLITNIVRGSVGFVLEEAGESAQAQLVDTPLRVVVDEVADIFSRIGAVDEATFDDAAAAMDQRVLGSLRDFFKLLDDQHATLRIVSGDKDFLLDRPTVSLASSRVQAIQIEERGDFFTGTLYPQPSGRRFEMETVDAEGKTVIIGGSVSPRAAAQLAGQESIDGVTFDRRLISSRPMKVEIQTRVIRELNRAPRKVYRLLSLVGPADGGSGGGGGLGGSGPVGPAESRALVASAMNQQGGAVLTSAKSFSPAKKQLVEPVKITNS